MRRGLRALSSVLIVAGALLIADAAVTLAWQEPVTALIAKLRQDDLGRDLERLEAAPPSAAERAALVRLRAARERIAFRARALRRRVADGDAIGRIRLPRVDASWVIVEGIGPADLRRGPGHYPMTALPGLRGTVGIAGHRTTHGAPFRDLDRLRRGDVVEVEMPYAKVSYRVERTRIVRPADTWVVRRGGRDRLVLTACHPKYSAAQRIVVFARELHAVERPA